MNSRTSEIFLLFVNTLTPDVKDITEIIASERDVCLSV